MADLKTLGAGKYLHLVANDRWEWARRPAEHDAACIIATDTHSALILVEQFRHPLGTNTIELPAGLVGDEAGKQHEGILTAAARELREETGYESKDWRFLMRAASSAGLTSETPAIVAARNCYKTGPGGGVDDENITVHVVARDGAEAWIAEKTQNGCIFDARVYVGLAVARGLLSL
ncbi:MAG: NUDIX hydrolase [Pseudomonadota bacterium]